MYYIYKILCYSCFDLRYNVNVDSLLSLFTFRDFELYVLSLFEAAEAVFVDSCVVNEDVATCFGCDEAITFG